MRMHRNCSEFIEYKINWKKYIKLFQRRGYTHREVDRTLEGVRKMSRRNLLVKKKPVKKTTRQAPFLSPHSEALVATAALSSAAAA